MQGTHAAACGRQVWTHARMHMPDLTDLMQDLMQARGMGAGRTPPTPASVHAIRKTGMWALSRLASAARTQPLVHGAASAALSTLAQPAKRGRSLGLRALLAAPVVLAAGWVLSDKDRAVLAVVLPTRFARVVYTAAAITLGVRLPPSAVLCCSAGFVGVAECCFPLQRRKKVWHSSRRRSPRRCAASPPRRRLQGVAARPGGRRAGGGERRVPPALGRAAAAPLLRQRRRVHQAGAAHRAAGAPRPAGHAWTRPPGPALASWPCARGHWRVHQAGAAHRAAGAPLTVKAAWIREAAHLQSCAVSTARRAPPGRPEFVRPALPCRPGCSSPGRASEGDGRAARRTTCCQRSMWRRCGVRCCRAARCRRSARSRTRSRRTWARRRARCSRRWRRRRSPRRPLRRRAARRLGASLRGGPLSPRARRPACGAARPRRCGRPCSAPRAPRGRRRAAGAQVHRAVGHDGRALAVKVQHARLRDSCAADILTVETVVRAAHLIFPNFNYQWLVDEMKDNLPKVRCAWAPRRRRCADVCVRRSALAGVRAGAGL